MVSKGEIIQLVHTATELELPWLFRVQENPNGNLCFAIFKRPKSHLRVGAHGFVSFKGQRGQFAQFQVQDKGDGTVNILSMGSGKYFGYNPEKKLLMGRAGTGPWGTWTVKKFSLEDATAALPATLPRRKPFLNEHLYRDFLAEEGKTEGFFSDMFNFLKAVIAVDPPESKEGQFTDPEFPQGDQCLGAEVAGRVKCEFRRPHQFASKPALFDQIEPGDVRQGSLGDCWLMSSLSAVAEYPAVIEHLFVESGKAREDGRYTVRIFDPAQKKYVQVVVDDALPCNRGSGPAFAKSVRGELWPCIVEKAYAKWVGSYAKLSGGWPALALEAITGAPSRLYKFPGPKIMGLSFGDLTVKKASQLTGGASLRYTNEGYTLDEFWTKLKNFDEDDNLMTLASPGKDVYSESQGPKDDFGIVGGHAYSLISVAEIGGFKLCQIRNPWGDFEWGGDWSDRSAKWQEHKDVYEALKPKLDKDDGIFWMSYEEMVGIFTSVTVNFMTRALARHQHAKVDANGLPQWVDGEDEIPDSE